MNVQRLAVLGSIAAIGAAVVAGLWLIGSPAEQRLLRLDEQRVNELRSLANGATFHWTNDRELPDTAEGLVDGQLLTRVPTDPITREPYEYRVTGPLQFEVCGTFDRPSRPHEAGDFWYHDSGRRCFQFNVSDRPRF
jgi:hypothetical protein